MRTLTQAYLGGLEVNENCYKVDLAVLERYQAFSTEVLRLSLLGIAGYGFLISNVIFRVGPGQELKYLQAFSNNKELLAAGAIALGISAATAPGHRYFSTDCLTHFVRRLRLSQYAKSTTEVESLERALDTIVHEEESLAQDLRKCHKLLVLACLSLFVGIWCFAAAFARTLFA